MSLQGGGAAGKAHRRSQAAAEFGNVRTCWEGYEKVVTRLGQDCKVTERLHIQGTKLGQSATKCPRICTSDQRYSSLNTKRSPIPSVPSGLSTEKLNILLSVKEKFYRNSHRYCKAGIEM